MKRLAPILCLLMFGRLCVPSADAQQTVRAIGAVSVALPLSEATPILKAEKKIQLLMRAGPSGTGLDALGDRFVDIALCSREVTSIDRAGYPQIQFTEIPLGVQVVAMAVSRDVWEGGVRSLSADQVRGIYEGNIKNWKEVGGPDQKIRVFMSEQGKGQWEIFVQWLYGEIKKAPIWKGESVKEILETRNMLDFITGSFALIPPSFVNNRTIYALAIQGDSGAPVEPTLANVLLEKYPMSRPLLLVTDNKPTGPVKVVIDFMVSERGQALVKKFGYVTLEELRAAKAAQ